MLSMHVALAAFMLGFVQVLMHAAQVTRTGFPQLRIDPGISIMVCCSMVGKRAEAIGCSLAIKGPSRLHQPGNPMKIYSYYDYC